MTEAERLFKALHAVFGDSESFTSKEIHAKSGMPARAEYRELNAALENALRNRRFRPATISMWLNKHLTVTASDLYLQREWIANSAKWGYMIHRIPDDETLASEHAEADARIQSEMQQRDKFMSTAALNKRMDRLAKESKRLSDDEERRDRRDKRDKEKANRKAQAKIATAAKNNHSQQTVTVSPQIGHFSTERYAEKAADNLKAAGFDAKVGYLTGTKLVVFIDDGEFDLDTLKREAERSLRVVRIVDNPIETNREAAQSREVECQTANLGYNPDVRYLMRGDNDSGHPIKLRPLSSWCPFKVP